jgi:hypothetical protein
MYKKLFITLMLLCAGSCAYAQKYNTTFTGFQNLERKQQLIAINNLQAIADNDTIRFSSQWPSEYFSNDGVYSYVYLAKNDVDSLDIIKFDVDISGSDSCGLAEKVPEFCVPKVSPIYLSYVYNERLIVHYTPNFIDNPEENAVFELVVKDGRYLGNKLITNTIIPKEKAENHDCSLIAPGKAKICKATDPETNTPLYTEHLILKDPEKPVTKDNVFKYVKYNNLGKKVEEYTYSNGKHVFYDDNGEIVQLYQVNAEKFRFFSKKMPDLYIDIDFVRDINDRVVEEIYKDRNQKVMRRYVAEYEHGDIKNIHVFDTFNKADWYVTPIGNQALISSPSFPIRY